MAEYQERSKRSSSSNNNRAIEPERYGGSYPKYSQPPVEITAERLKEIEEFEDEYIFKRFCSPEVYNKYKKQEIETEQLLSSLENDKRKQTRPKRKGLKFSKKYLQAKEKTLQRRLETVQRQLAESEKEELGQVPVEKQDIALFDERDKDLSKDKTDTATISVEKRDPAISEKKDVANLTQSEKLLEALNLTIQKLPSALGSQLKALINPASIAVMVGVLGAYTASHAVGVGFIADAVMGVSAGVFLGWQAIDVAKDLWAFAQYVNATTEEDLDKAAEHLARAIMTVGFDVILGILTKKAAGKVSQHVDELKQVDEVHAHHDGANAGRVNDIDNADKTLSAGNEVTPTTANNIEYPEGISYRQDLPKHLQTFDVFTQKNGVGGAHNLDAFNQAVAEKSMRIISKTEHPTVKGIYQIEYEVPKLDKQLNPTGDYKRIKRPKTVYDPAIHSDDKILQLGQEAAAKGLNDAIANNTEQFTQEAGGITFRAYVDLDTKEVTNVHPDFNNEI